MRHHRVAGIYDEVKLLIPGPGSKKRKKKGA
jgi:hypothetical protein